MVDAIELNLITKNLLVLYVEDDLNTQEIMKNILERYFENVATAQDGKEALEKFEKNRFDLIITDINMPMMGGIEMIKEIKKMDREQKIVVVTAFSDSSYLLDAIRLGVDGFIIKPVSNDQLVTVLYQVATAIKEKKENIQHRHNLERLVMERTSQLVIQNNKLEEKSEELERELVTDKLTGLKNKKKLQDDIKKAGTGILLALNVDNFDHVNSTYGYKIGDSALKIIAKFLSKIKPNNANLYRLVSDEFAYLCKGCSLEEAKSFAQKINQEMFKNIVKVEDIELHFSFTIGIAECCDGDVIRKAHIAMKEVRSIGKSRHHVYSSSSDIELRQQNNIEWMRRVKQALQNNDIIPYYQPIINNKNNKAEKYECLARMKYQNEIINPSYFIGPALNVGLISNITRAMIDKSFEYFKNRDGVFSLNITENDFKDGYLVDYLMQKSTIGKNMQKRVILEVLEQISVENSSEIIGQLDELKRSGFRIALDDFGSEKSNFSRLQTMEIDFIKIDSAFIKNIDIEQNSYKITETITKLAKSLGAEVIAEHVHSKSIQEKVLNLDIDYSQGYLFGEPKPSI